MPVSPFASFVAVSALSIAALGCGGKQADAKTPDPAASGSAPAAASNATGPAPDSSATTTTTTTLGAGGDLQGAKLGSSSTTVIENRSDAGAPHKSAGGEPGRTREDIQTIIVAHRDEARACYDAAYKKNPVIEGNLDVKMTIDPEGNISEIAVDESKSTIHDPAVGDCVIAVIKKIHFAKHSQGKETRVHYPFDFHPKANQIGKGAAPAHS